MQDVQTTLPIGSVVRDRYVIEDLLGKGGFGAVYLVSDLRVKGNLFALKEVIDPSKQERERFEFECNVLRKLDYPALPRVYHVFENQHMNRAYMLMDYVDGPNLEVLRLQQPQKRFSLPQVMSMMAPIVGAIGYLHKQRPPVIHRDIKPANIIVPDGNTSSMLVDFGIAKEYDQDSTTTAVRRCSPGYGAPEQYARGTNPSTDIYGLGATFYALLTGNIPADALYRMTQLGSRRTDPLEPANQLVPTLPVAVAQVIQRSMHIESTERYATVEEFWQAMKAAANWQQVAAPVTPLPAIVTTGSALTARHATAPTAPLHPGTIQKRHKRRILPGLLALLAVIALVVGIGFGAGLWPALFHPANPGPTSTATTGTQGKTATTGNSTTPSHGSTTTPGARASATPGAGRTPSPSPGQTPTPLYPALAPAYEGQIHNTPANVGSDMSLTSIQQKNDKISGTLTLGSSLLGGGPFSGSVSQDKKIQFLVQSSNVAPLFFTGTIQGNGSMSGNYCSVDSGTHCSVNAGGYGIWSVKPVSAGSISSSSDTTSSSGGDNENGNVDVYGNDNGKGHKKK